MTLSTIAYFITDHGFGHAGRAAAIMAAMERLVPHIRFELFTTSPKWIFEDSVKNAFGCHSVQTDVGLVQLSPLEEDLAATVRALKHWIPFDGIQVQRLADLVNRLACHLVICDISALGIAVARRAGVPSVLIENFTWDFIYGAYTKQAPEMKAFASYLTDQYAQADVRIQTEPLCSRVDGTICLSPISRVPRTPPAVIRGQLKTPEEAKMVLVSMGGVPDQFRFLDRMPGDIDPYIVIPGSNRHTISHEKVIQLPAHSRFFHPDLLSAADLLIGKAGYSTTAEAYHAGIPFAYVARPQSPESPALERFITHRMESRAISAQTYADGQWLQMLPDLLKLQKFSITEENGSTAVARWIGDRYL
jgi:hypothetical protein